LKAAPRPAICAISRRVLARIAALAVACFALALSGCRKAPKSPEERGAGIFARSCASCHGPAGRPTRGLGLPVTPRDLSDARFYQQRSDADLKAAIRDGKGAMPAFGAVLTDEDLALVIAHLHTLAKPQ
jgi:mono/diheme cytochrome c family protein